MGASAEAVASSAWPSLPEDHPLSQLSGQLSKILEEARYNEMYGVELFSTSESKPVPFSTLLILQKFLRANTNDPSRAGEQLLTALKWRKEFQPLKAKDEIFDGSHFEGLGYVTELSGVPESQNDEDVAAFNIYGAVKNTKATFGDLDGFIRWRVALMEITLAHLHLNDAKQPIPDYSQGPDPYQALQVHDYLSISFLRQPAEVKAASTKTIQLFQQMYPETMAKKYFVNVPMFMQWIFAAMQMFKSKETMAKMKWLSYGSELYMDLGSSVPKAYGGTGPELEVSSETPKYSTDPSTTASAKATT